MTKAKAAKKTNLIVPRPQRRIIVETIGNGFVVSRPPYVGANAAMRDFHAATTIDQACKLVKTLLTAP